MNKKNPQYLIIFLILSTFIFQIGCSQKSKRELLFDDCRQLAHILETAHPDPYIRGGGKIAFHRRLQKMIQSIPEKGMTKEEFYDLISPFVASVGDGHTFLSTPFKLNSKSPGGIPLYFKIVEESLYVGAVAKEDHKSLIGSLLISVEDIDLRQLVQRQKSIRGCDSDYHALHILRQDGLWYREYLRCLLPHWTGNDQIRIVLQKPDGNKKELIINIPAKIDFPLISAKSNFEMPSTEKKDFVYMFLDPDKKSILLRVDNLFTYRETFEMHEGFGIARRENLAKQLYSRYHGTSAPQDYLKTIAGIPSATEIFRNMVKEMKTSGTKRIYIDLRRNQGGADIMSAILIYLFYGKDKLIEHYQKSNSFNIKKYSELYFKNYQNTSIKEINSKSNIPLTKNDYDFSLAYNPDKPFSQQEAKARIQGWAENTPTFWKEFQSEEFSAYYKPEQIIVICSAETYSAGYGFLYGLYRTGAIIVGTASTQAGNGFGDWISEKLHNSGLWVYVSHQQFIHFPEDPEKGVKLMPHYLLTYEKLKSYNFDPNAEIIYALEVSEKKKSMNLPIE